MKISDTWRRLAALLPLLLVGATASAQGVQPSGVLAGVVTAADGGDPLEDVHVYVAALKRGTVTDAAGRYRIEDLRAGSYTVEFSSVGFVSVALRVEVAPSGETRLDASLAVRTVEAEEVVVIADEARPAADVPLQTLSFDEARRLQTGEMSLWAALDRLPGVARSTGGPGIERPYLRGMSGGRILVMLENVPYSYQTWDPELGLNTDGNGTERIDVVQGPSTLLYGPGAMGGVVSLLPEYPAPVGTTTGAYTLALASNSEGIYNELAVRQSRRGWFWGARAGFDSHADYRPGESDEVRTESEPDRGEEEVRNSRYRHLQARVFGGVSRAWGSTRLTYTLLSHRNGIVESEEEESGVEEEGGRDIEAPFHAVDDHIVTSDTRLRVGDGWLDGVLGLQVNRQKEVEPVPGGGNATEPNIELMLTTLHLRAGYERPLQGGWTLRAGFQGFLQGNESEGEEPFVPGAEVRQGGAYALLRWTDGTYTAEGGARYDVQSLDSTEPRYERPIPEDERPGMASRSFSMPSGSIGLTARVSPALDVKLNVGMGAAAPSLAALTARGALREIRRFLVGDRDLDAESNAEADLGATLRAGAVTLTGGVFFERVRNYTYEFATGATERRTFDAVPFDFPVYEYRQEDATFRGGHVEASVAPPSAPGLRVFSRLDLVLARLEDDAKTWLPLIPAHHVLSGVEWGREALGPFRRFRAGVEVDTYLEQDRVPSWEAPSEAYTLVNISLGGRLPIAGRELQIGLHGLNLLNEAYTSHLSLLRQDGIRDVGRNVTFTVRVPFGG